MEIGKSIQVIYAPGTWGHAVRWMLDRFSKDSKFKNVKSPWDANNRVHGFNPADYDKKFKRGHQLDGRDDSPDPEADKIIIGFAPTDLLFVERCRFYRNPGMETEQHRYKTLIDEADRSFVAETFGNMSESKAVAKELMKIQFHDVAEHKWWHAMNKIIKEKEHYTFKISSLYEQEELSAEFLKISDTYKLDLDIDKDVVKNVVDTVNKEYVVQTKDRARAILEAVKAKTNLECADLDILEQAYIETELEKANDCVIFPYGTNWFTDTAGINEFLDTYPSYLKHMNPRLPWYNNIRNPYHVKGQIDKSR